MGEVSAHPKELLTRRWAGGAELPACRWADSEKGSIRRRPLSWTVAGHLQGYTLPLYPKG